MEDTLVILDALLPACSSEAIERGTTKVTLSKRGTVPAYLLTLYVEMPLGYGATFRMLAYAWSETKYTAHVYERSIRDLCLLKKEAV